MKTERTAGEVSGPDNIAFLVWAATVEHPELFVTPLVHALAARALDCSVEIHFAGPAVRWLVEGVAADSYPTPCREKSILAFLRELADEGVLLLTCSMASAAWIKPGEVLIDECHGAVGATAFVARTLDPAWRTAVF